VWKTGSGLYCATFAAASGQRRRELSGSHTTLKAAVTQIAADNVTRLRWGPRAGNIILSSTGAYQLTCTGRVDEMLSTAPVGDELWTALYMAQDKHDELAVDEPLEQAQAACQAHADKHRGAGQ
jgi:hypothetical protein